MFLKPNHDFLYKVFGFYQGWKKWKALGYPFE